MSIPIPQPRIPGAPAKASKGRSGFKRWFLRIWLGLLALALVLYLAGRLWEPARAILAKAPLVGGAFQNPVADLPDWLKPTTPTPVAQPEPTQTGTADLSGLSAQLSAQQAQLNLTQQALDQKEQEQKVRDQRLAERLQEVEAREKRIEQLEANLSQLEIIRAMKPTAVTAMFEQLTDDEALDLLRYMENEEAAQILGNLEAERAAELFRKLGELKQSAATGS